MRVTDPIRSSVAPCVEASDLGGVRIGGHVFRVGHRGVEGRHLPRQSKTLSAPVRQVWAGRRPRRVEASGASTGQGARASMWLMSGVDAEVDASACFASFLQDTRCPLSNSSLLGNGAA